MSDLFEWMHAQFFEELFGLDEESRAKMAEYLREIGLSEAEIAQHCAAGIQAGQSFSCCHLGDVGRFVERILFHQGAQGVLLLISRPPFDEACHLDISVLEIVPQLPGEAELPGPDQPPRPDEREAKEWPGP